MHWYRRLRECPAALVIGRERPTRLRGMAPLRARSEAPRRTARANGTRAGRGWCTRPRAWGADSPLRAFRRRLQPSALRRARTLRHDGRGVARWAALGLGRRAVPWGRCARVPPPAAARAGRRAGPAAAVQQPRRVRGLRHAGAGQHGVERAGRGGGHAGALASAHALTAPRQRARALFSPRARRSVAGGCSAAPLAPARVRARVAAKRARMPTAFPC